MNINRPHHQSILSVLSQFNQDYLRDNSILFGGGTRIALEMDEFRESIDIDFLCTDSNSYRAVRSQVTSNSFGDLVSPDSTIIFAREIRADRDAVRTFVQNPEGGNPIKLEFVHFDYYELAEDARHDFFPVPFIDHHSCFVTKLLANADRYDSREKKDIIDLSMMVANWGDIPQSAWKKADEKYGYKAVVNGIERAVGDIEKDKDSFVDIAVNSLSINENLAYRIFEEFLPTLIDQLSGLNLTASSK